ncbi:hypothetical protein ALC57_05886, partial [Trachymyrmex cornetzi]
KAADITNKIIFMLAKDNMPFSTVEKEGFYTLMKTLVPLYKIPCRKTITRCLEEKYEILSRLIKNQLATKYVSLTTDISTEKTAIKSLTIIATSVPAERLFSKAGRIMSEDRNKLSSKHLSQLLFLSSLDIRYWHLD